MMRGAGQCARPLHEKCTPTQNMKQWQRGPARPRIPAPEEEDPRVKCKDCGAFGHRARSKRCPMKCWDGALAPRPLCPPKGKENQTPWKPQILQKPGPLDQAEGQKEQRERPEEQQRKNPLGNISGGFHQRQKHTWKDETETCDYLRRPCRPMPVHTTRKTFVLEPVLTSQPPVKNTNVRRICLAVPPIKRTERVNNSLLGQNKVQEMPVTGTCQPIFMPNGQSPAFHEKPTYQNPEDGSFKVPQAFFKSQGMGQGLKSVAHLKEPDVSPEPSLQPAAHTKGYGSSVSVRAPGKRSAQVPIHTCQSSPKKPRPSPLQIPQGSTGRPGLGTLLNAQLLPGAKGPSPKESHQMTSTTAAQGSSIEAMPADARDHLSTSQPCRQAHSPQSSSAPSQPLKMIFKRLHNDCWSSQVLTATSSHPPEEPNPATTGPSLLEKSEGHGSQMPRSVLYEDLQVSSSSEESDGE